MLEKNNTIIPETSEELVNKLMLKPEIKLLLEMEKLSDINTYEHSISVALLSAKMTEFVKEYTYKERQEIVIGALLHDIGKVFLPFNLPQVHRAVTRPEYDIIKIHTAISYEIVSTVFSKTVQNICLYHHERPNGSGYTNHAKLYDIPQEALLVQVADIYDALTRERSYKKSYDKESAIQEMKNEAQNFSIDDGYLKILENVINIMDS